MEEFDRGRLATVTAFNKQIMEFKIKFDELQKELEWLSEFGLKIQKEIRENE